MDPNRALDLARRHLPRAEDVTAVFERGTRTLAYEIDERAFLKVAKLPQAARSLDVDRRARREPHALPISGPAHLAPIPELDLVRLWSEGSHQLSALGLLTDEQIGFLTRRLEGLRPELQDERQTLVHGDLWNDNCFVDPS